VLPENSPRTGARAGRSHWAALLWLSVGAAGAFAVSSAIDIAGPRAPGAGAREAARRSPVPISSGVERPAPGLAGFHDLTPAEARAVATYLTANPGMRLAGDDDARDSDDARDIAGLYRIYHPYFVRGDLDDDGNLDFAAALVERRGGAGTSWFTVAVFRSDGRGGFLEACPIERAISLSSGDLSIDRDCLVITPDLSEDAARRYRWNGARRTFDFVADDDTDSSQRPSSRI